MKRQLVIAIAAALGLSACGGGGSGSGGSTATGFAIPTEISAVPSSSSPAASLATGLAVQLNALSRAVSDLPATSDYKKTSTRKYIEEHSLEQFAIIETIMKAVAQTNYADAANINAGPYKAMVAWEDNEGGVDMKTLEPWVVSSQLITLNGQTVNRLQAWIEENDNGTPKVIKAQFDIYQSATQNADGSYADYGVWNLNVKFNDAATDFFVASATIENGMTVLKINHSETRADGGGSPATYTTRAVMHRAGTQGYGQVAFDDHLCDMSGCMPDPKNVKYAYNVDYVGLQDGSNPEVYKDRNSQTDLTHRYGLFYAVAGTDDNGKAIVAGDSLMKHKSFGFPVSYDDNGVKRHAYYGAWQGRHQLWGGGPSGGAIPAGTLVTREDHGSSTAAATFFVSPTVTGTLTKRTLVQGALTDILNIAVETWINKHYNLVWDGGQWTTCTSPGFFYDPMGNTCRDVSNATQAPAPFTELASLAYDPNNTRRNVNINRYDPTLNGVGGPVDYVYLTAAPVGFSGFTTAGFYPATRDMQTGQLTPNPGGPVYTPALNDNLNADIGGSIYVAYTGDYSGASSTTGWVQKKLLSFDQQTWTPTFDATPGADTEFALERGRDYYINSHGANFVIKKVAASVPVVAGDYEVMIELQTAANPVNFGSILPAGTAYLRSPWRPEARYTLVTDPVSGNFLKLVYANTDTQTPPTFTLGAVLSNGEWGLQAYSAGVDGTAGTADDAPLMADGTPVVVDQYGIPTTVGQRPVEFNWEYSADGGWGTQTFLCTTLGCPAAADYKLLSDPVSLNPITVTNGAGDSKTLSLQFDGWMHGLPDLYQDLSKNGWQMTTDISNKIINIPAGTSVTDGNGVEYFVKPLEVSVFINEVNVSVIPAGSVPDLTQVSPTELDSLPTFVEHSMGAIPTNADGSPLVPKYSEGNPVE